jgi:predicted RNA-binding protein
MGMCQISVVMEQADTTEQLVQDNVTSLNVEQDGIVITSLFEGSRKLAGAIIHHIDFMAGKVVLQQAS